MSIKIPFLINKIGDVNPLQDKRWVPDGDDMWFLPCVLDLKNKTYSGWWYGIKDSYESEHHHSGISHGTVLRGKMILDCFGKKFSFQENDSFLLPPQTNHTAEMMANDKGFLFFGSIVGETIYLNHQEKLDVHSYYEIVDRHYKHHNIDFSTIGL